MEISANYLDENYQKIKSWRFYLTFIIYNLTIEEKTSVSYG